MSSSLGFSINFFTTFKFFIKIYIINSTHLYYLIDYYTIQNIQTYDGSFIESIQSDQLGIIESINEKDSIF